MFRDLIKNFLQIANMAVTLVAATAILIIGFELTAGQFSCQFVWDHRILSMALFVLAAMPIGILSALVAVSVYTILDNLIEKL